MTEKMTAENIADRVMQYCGVLPGKEPLRSDVIRAIQVAEQAATEVERQRCLADVCEGCRKKIPCSIEPTSKMWAHRNPGDRYFYRCRAPVIRDRMEKGDG